MPKEKWRPVPGYKKIYEVSDQGRVRSLDRISCDRHKRQLKGRLLKQVHQHGGRLRVVLSKGQSRWRVLVHHLVLIAFVGPRPKGMQARHFPDRNPSNNKLGNLSWSTPLVNQRDRDIHGTNNKGERNASAKLNSRIVRHIRRIKRWPHGSMKAIAQKYGVDVMTIRQIRSRETWSHI